MKCFYHNDREVVAQCTDCRRGLCSECATKYEPSLCNSCASAINENLKKEFYKSIGLSVAGLIVGILFADSFTLCIMMMCVPWGWKTLNRITPNFFLFMSWAGWIIYFSIKLVIAMIIGVFVTPYQLYKSIKGLIAAKQMDDHINT